MAGSKNHIARNIIIAVVSVFAAAVLAFSVMCAALCTINPNPNRPPRIDNPTGYVRAEGTNLYDGEGNLLTFHGVNLGNWFVQEPWMAVSAVGDFQTGSYTQKRGLEAMQANPNLTDEQIEQLERLYIDTYIQEQDFANIADMGLNCVRINFTWYNLTTDGETLRGWAFDKLDWAVEMCQKYGIYAILDLHGAIGSQNMDNHSGNDAEYDLYGNEEHMRMTVQLWEEIAKRYCDNTTVAAYDLLNEPRRAPGKFTGREQFDFYDELYKAVRKHDDNHLIMMECFTFPTHGVHPDNYDWENVCYSYHIYNLTPFSQDTAVTFYRALHNLMGYNVPIIVGEWSCWDEPSDWTSSMDYFDDLGWSYLSWTYKTDKYNYSREAEKYHNFWGIYELDIPPVDLSSATFEEIAQAYSAVGTENAQPTFIRGIYEERFAKSGD